MKKISCPYKRSGYIGYEEIPAEFCTFKSNEEFEEFDDSYCFFKKENECPIYRLSKENQELKKQLKNFVMRMSCDGKCEVCEHYKKAYLSEIKQKEFIKYLEDEMERIKATDIWDSFKKASLVTFQHILSKYKKIIGVDKE